jgi:hypothetical protein
MLVVMDPALRRIRRLLARHKNAKDPDTLRDVEVQLLDAAAAYWRDPWLGDVEAVRLASLARPSP